MKDKKERAAEIRKFLSKNSIASFEKLDRFFKISELDSDNISLDSIRSKIVEKINFFSKLLEEVIQPEASLQCIYECRSISEDRRKEIFGIYRNLKKLERQSNLLDLESNDRQNAEFINQAVAEWEKIKDKIKPLIEGMKESWEKDEQFKASDMGYLG